MAKPNRFLTSTEAAATVGATPERKAENVGETEGFTVEDPPPKRTGKGRTRAGSKYDPLLTFVQENPGVWVKVDTTSRVRRSPGSAIVKVAERRGIVGLKVATRLNDDGATWGTFVRIEPVEGVSP